MICHIVLPYIEFDQKGSAWNEYMQIFKVQLLQSNPIAAFDEYPADNIVRFCVEWLV